MIKKVVILKPKKSLNFSESCNIGVANSNNNNIFIANDDIILSKNTLEELVKNTSDDTITGPDSNCNLGFQTDYAYTIKDIPLVPAMTLEQVKDIIPEIYNLNTIKKDIVKRDWLAFFAIMLTRKCFNDVGKLDENFVYDREDLDWCVRASQINKNFRQIFSSYCFHFGGISRKRKHVELGLKHDLDQEHNETYYKSKWGIMDKKILGIYCHDAWEFWDENSLNTSIDPNKPNGIGGSETQVILLSRELTKLGYKIKIFNKCKNNHFDTSGYDIEYIPFQDFPKYAKTINFDYFVASRYLDCFKYNFNSKKTFVMIHDVFIIMDQNNKTNVYLDKIDKYFCLSHRHKDFVSEYHNIPKDKILVTSNGIDFTRFNKNIKKNPYKMIYSSSPDRGLDIVLPLFDQVKQQVPQAELHIFYGFENFRDQNYIKLIKDEINKRKDVHYHGRVGQDVLAEEFLSSGIWGYATNFAETFCITAVEAMASGTIPVTSDYWGLTDTVKEGGILIPMHNNPNTLYLKSYQDVWVNNIVELMKDSALAQFWRERGIQRASRFSWEAVAKQWDNYFKNEVWIEIQ